MVGDVVAIEYAGEKLSKRKAFVLTEIIHEARRYTHPVTGVTYTAPHGDLPVRHSKMFQKQ